MGEGKGATSFTRILEAIASFGHEVHVSLPAPLGEEAPPTEDYRGFSMHRAPTRKRLLPTADLPLPLRLYDRVACYLRYQRWADRTAGALAAAVRPDLILSMGTFEVPAARRLGTKLGVPNVTRLFGNGLAMYMRDPKRFYANFPEVLAFRTPADLLILTNDGADGEKLARRLHVPAERFVHLRNGLDFEVFTPGPPSGEVRRRLGLNPSQPLLLTVTRLAREKMLGRAIGALPELLRSRPDAVLALVGEGPEREALESQARDLGVTAALRFPGAVANRELPDWYRHAGLVLSLLDRTNASNPVFEAMACERVVVALDAGMTHEIVKDGETGVLVRRSDLPRLGSILAGLLDDPERRRRMGEAAHRHIRSLLVSPKERLAREVHLLEEVVLRSRGARGTIAGDAR